MNYLRERILMDVRGTPPIPLRMALESQAAPRVLYVVTDVICGSMDDVRITMRWRIKEY